MRIFYRLFSKITGGVAARIGKATFKSVWSRIDQEDPPKPARLDASLPKVVAGALKLVYDVSLYAAFRSRPAEHETLS